VSASALVDADYVTLGNKRRAVLLPLGSRAGARAGVGMLGATRRVNVIGQAVAMTALSLAGPRLVPGERCSLDDVVDRDLFLALWADVEGCIGPVDAVAALGRPQAARAGFAVLALRGHRVVAFVRLQRASAGSQREAAVLRAVAAFGPRTFAVPSVVGSGTAQGWDWIATEPLPGRLHRSDWTADPESLGHEISAALSEFVGPPPRDGWRPMHGDLAPWNLRRTRRRRFLIDWEAADFGPPHADATYLSVTRAAVRGRPPSRPLDPEAARFWSERLEQRHHSGADARLNQALLRYLRPATR
jgi:hypothetical protein